MTDGDAPGLLPGESRRAWKARLREGGHQPAVPLHELGYGELDEPWRDSAAEAARTRMAALKPKLRNEARRLTVWCDEDSRCPVLGVSMTLDGLLIHPLADKVDRFDRHDLRDTDQFDVPYWATTPAVFVEAVWREMRGESGDSEALPLACPCSCRHTALRYVDLRQVAQMVTLRPDTRNVRVSDLQWLP